MKGGIGKVPSGRSISPHPQRDNEQAWRDHLGGWWSFDGREIAYRGIGFEGSPREVFWSRYIEPFLEQLSISEIEATISLAREKGVDARFLLPELQGLLSAGFRKVYGEMADVDRCLRGKGYPSSVPLRSVNLEIQRMDKFLDERIVAEIEMWRPKPWFEVWHERNKFWIWLIGIVLTVAGILAKLLNLF